MPAQAGIQPHPARWHKVGLSWPRPAEQKSNMSVRLTVFFVVKAMLHAERALLTGKPSPHAATPP